MKRGSHTLEGKERTKQISSVFHHKPFWVDTPYVPSHYFSQLLAEFDAEHEFLQNPLLHQMFSSLETGPSPPHRPSGQEQEVPDAYTQVRASCAADARNEVASASPSTCMVPLGMLVLRLLLLAEFWWPSLHCPPHQQVAHTAESAGLQHSPAELCWHMRWCHVFTLAHVSLWLCHSFLLQKASGLQSSKTPTEYKKTPCLRK